MIGVQSLEALQPRAETPLSRLRVGRWAPAVRELFWTAWQWICSKQLAVWVRSDRRSLRVAESVSLGEKRSVHLIEVDGQRLLLGASAAGVTLLSQLAPAKKVRESSAKDLAFADVMECCGSKPAKRKARAVTTAKESA